MVCHVSLCDAPSSGTVLVGCFGKVTCDVMFRLDEFRMMS